MADKVTAQTLNYLEKQVEALETRNAFQDDVIEQLNQEISVHQLQIAELKAQLSLIAARIKDNQETEPTSQQIEPPPPHY